MIAASDTPWGGFAFIGLVVSITAISQVVSHRRLLWRRTVLERCLPFYRDLGRGQRRTFEERVLDFIEDKDFHGRGIEVTEEMKLMIAGAAMQLTFGLGDLLLMYFTHIIVYPDRYRSLLRNEEHLGEVNPGMRAIVISWEHFVEGYHDGGDARNVGLHEMAHALWLENRSDDVEMDFLDPLVVEQWRKLAEEEAHRIREGRSRLFRTYAATDQMEFFAVAVEYFFEQPVQFKEEMPEMYDTMKQLLRQDPAATAGTPGM